MRAIHIAIMVMVYLMTLAIACASDSNPGLVENVASAPIEASDASEDVGEYLSWLCAAERYTDYDLGEEPTNNQFRDILKRWLDESSEQEPPAVLNEYHTHSQRMMSVWHSSVPEDDEPYNFFSIFVAFDEASKLDEIYSELPTDILNRMADAGCEVPNDEDELASTPTPVSYDDDLGTDLPIEYIGTGSMTLKYTVTHVEERIIVGRFSSNQNCRTYPTYKVEDHGTNDFELVGADWRRDEWSLNSVYADEAGEYPLIVTADDDCEWWLWIGRAHEDEPPAVPTSKMPVFNAELGTELPIEYAGTGSIILKYTVTSDFEDHVVLAMFRSNPRCQNTPTYRVSDYPSEEFEMVDDWNVVLTEGVGLSEEQGEYALIVTADPGCEWRLKIVDPWDWE